MLEVPRVTDGVLADQAYKDLVQRNRVRMCTQLGESEKNWGGFSSCPLSNSEQAVASTKTEI